MLKSLLAALCAVVSLSALAQHGAHAPKADTLFGRPGDPKKVSRTIEVDMSDQMRFAPADIQVKRGETIRFRVKNSGQTLHEMVIGTPAGLKQHAAEMKKHPGMKHDAPYLTHVAPGKNGSIVWEFSQAGDFQYACLVPGHLEAGMTGRIRVVATPAQAPEVEQYLSGAGMGYAKAAELNHFPGPMHVLELADGLSLSVEQRVATKALMDKHKAEARGIGAKLVDAERAVEALFRAGQVDEGALANAVRTAAALEGEYRLAHLDTHRRMRALLTAEQVRRYDELRGYAAEKGHQHKKH